jgi:hypothetical protein
VKLADLVPTSPRGLGMLRAAVCSVLAIQLAATNFAALGRLPVTLMHPPGVMEYLSWKFYDRLMTPAGMVVLQVLLVGSLVAATLGLFSSLSTKTAALLYLLYQGLLRSFGHFNHDEMVALWCLLIIAFTPSGDGFSLDAWLRGRMNTRPPTAYGYPILLMRCVLAWTYLTAGLLKLRLGGLAYFEPDSLLTLMIGNSLGNMHDTQFRFALMLPAYRWMITPGLSLAVVWELAFPLAVVSRRLRPWILGTGLLFHISTLLLMNITFPVQAAMYLVFVDWECPAAWMARLFSFEGTSLPPKTEGARPTGTVLGSTPTSAPTTVP